jgi:hypothetical protein
MIKKKIFFFLLLVFIGINSEAKQIANNVLISIDNSIITDADINKEINFLKFLEKDQIENKNEILKQIAVKNLIDRKIKDKEADFYKIKISEKELEDKFYNYLESMKINNEELDTFYNKNEIEKDYLRKIINTEIKWSKLISQLYENKLNVNLTEIEKKLEGRSITNENSDKLKNQLIISEKNLLLNKYASIHLEKSKKKYLIKFL